MTREKKEKKTNKQTNDKRHGLENRQINKKMTAEIAMITQKSNQSCLRNFGIKNRGAQFSNYIEDLALLHLQKT